MSLQPLTGIWWKKVDSSEKVWLGIALVWCLILFAMMPLWHLKGGQNPSFNTFRTTPSDFMKKVEAFVEAGPKVADDKGLPVIAPDPQKEVYMLGRLWQWYPALKLKKGQTYRLHLSSVDWQHGFSLQPENINVQVIPGYEMVMKITPNKSGEFSVICNEYCGIGHHQMIGKIYVK